VQTSTDTSRRLLAAAATCAVGFGAAWLLFVRTSAGQWLDGALLPRADRGGGYAQQTVLLEPAQLVLNRFGNPPLLGLLVVAIVVVGVLAHRIRPLLAALALFACAVGGASLAKQVIIRPEFGVVGSSAHNSFPSGHAAAAAALLLGFLLVVPARARAWVAVPGAIVASAVAAATMVVGWHRFSDVVGSLLLVATLFFLAAAVLSRWPAKPAPNAEPAPDAEPAPKDVPATGGVALATGGTLLMVPLIAVAPDAGLPLVAAIAAANALTMLVVWAAVRLSQPVAKAPDPDNTKPPSVYVHPGRL